MTLVFKFFSIAIMGIALTGCQNLFQKTGEDCTTVGPCNGNTVDMGNGNALNYQNQNQVTRAIRREPIIINATGYAAVSTSKRFSKSQARLMALRSSTLDAYRNLSERVYGLKLDGSSSLSNMVLQHDELRSYIDSYLVGAKVVSQREHQDGTFETVVEMALQENFRQCVSSPNNISNDPRCKAHQDYRTVDASSPTPTANFYTIE
ncbi:LPP20 family lipoprotein [Marinomonas flavescens]|uniref:LPP20 family lipoprotein n=1 Tax=Marinomonas flavescens TaxID=2529379 RepID=UPI0010567B3E|nr:LPP20 family lipoprotein [Marinomonas flavescens]